MECDLDDVSRVAQGLKVKVEALDRANIASRRIKGCHEGSSTDRARLSITA
jgi:syntaxin 1B/2/3